MFMLNLTEISKTDVFKSIFYVCKNVKRLLYDFESFLNKYVLL